MIFNPYALFLFLRNVKIVYLYIFTFLMTSRFGFFLNLPRFSNNCETIETSKLDYLKVPT